MAAQGWGRRAHPPLGTTPDHRGQRTRDLATKCQTFSNGERISFPVGNSAKSLISWQLRNMSLERGSPRQEKLSGNPSGGILAETPHRTS